jgi:hypothetical protein
MRLLTPLCTIFLTIGFCSRASYAQCSPIYLDDNGNIPLELKGKRPKVPPKAKKRPKGLKTVKPSLYETHIHYDGGSQYDGQIQNNVKTKEFFIEEPDHQAVCLELIDGTKIDLATKKRWRLTLQSEQDNTVISSDGVKNNHIHIDPGGSMGYRPSYDLDDPDPANPVNGTNNQMSGADFNGTPLKYTRGQYLIIHYCVSTDCHDKDGADQCKKP